MKKRLIDLKERLLVCYYALTKKKYSFFAFDKLEYQKSGAVCYNSNWFEEDKLAMETMIEFTQKLLNRLNGNGCRFE